MRVRAYTPDDAAACAEVFYRAVQEGAASQYSQEQRDVWCKAVPETAKYVERLAPLTTFVAVERQSILGFMSLRNDGELDMAFVLPEARGTGVAGKLYNAIETEAIRRGFSKITVHASHLFRPFLERRKWGVVRPNTVERDGVTLNNWVMERSLS